MSTARAGAVVQQREHLAPPVQSGLTMRQTWLPPIVHGASFSKYLYSMYWSLYILRAMRYIETVTVLIQILRLFRPVRLAFLPPDLPLLFFLRVHHSHVA